MIDISKLNSHYTIRILDESDLEMILDLYQKNTFYYQFCEARPTIKCILDDMKITPPGIDVTDKYFMGFFENENLVAVMDLVDGYPNFEVAYIGFFMMNVEYQGKKIGTSMIHEIAEYLKTIGKTEIRLGIDKGNPQSTHFWKKNGFEVIYEVDLNGWPKLVAKKSL